MGSSNRSPPPKEVIQPRLKSLLETSPCPWTYAIFWQRRSCSSSSAAILRWGDGYYLGPQDEAEEKLRAAECSAAQKEHRKRVLRQLGSLVSEPDEISDQRALEDDVTDTEWFFLVSMFEKFDDGDGLPGQAFLDSTPVWVVGAEQLEGSGCERARQGKSYGIKTMAFVPSGNVNGVIELGSTELIRQDSDFINEVRTLFDAGKGDGPPAKE